MGLQSWTRALKDLWQRLAYTDGYRWVDKYPASAWLRRDIGLSEDIVMREWDRVDEIRHRYCGWV